MRKLFLVLVFVAIALGAKAQENTFSIKGGAGFAMLQDDTDADLKLSWKFGLGYEFRLNDLIGIEPSLRCSMSTPTTFGIISPPFSIKRWSPIWISILAIKSAFTSVARFTVVPPSHTGFRLATGVITPVRPTW